mgnify:CR=1 FL=1
MKLEVLDIPEEAPVIDGSEELPHAQGDYDPTLDLSSYRYPCLLYTSDAADERSSVDLGGRRIIKKKNNVKNGDTVDV